MPGNKQKGGKGNKGVEDEEQMDEANARDDILAAIDALRKDFKTQLQEVVSSNQGIREAINSFSDRLEQAETRIGSAEDVITDLEAKVTKTQRDMLALARTVESIESRQRRLNLRLVGLPEKTEKNGRDLARFLAELLPNILGADNFPNPLAIDEAFRLPLSKKLPKRRPPPPRTILIKFRWLSDKEQVMAAAREKKSLQLDDDNPLMFFPDLTPEIQEKRRKFDGVKVQLHNLGIEFGMLHPAKMRLYLDGGETLTFLTPAEAQDYIKTVEKERSPSTETILD